MAESTRVLVAEDDALTRLILQTYLSSWDYEVVIATNGQQALNILQEENRPVIALLDWMMPVMDGVVVCRRLPAWDEDRPYIIMVTSRNQTSDLVEALNAGADDFITKPVEPSELRARLLVGIRSAKIKQDLLSRVRQLEAERQQSNP